MPHRYFLFMSLLIALMFGASAHAQVDDAFQPWLENFKQQAASQGISQPIIDEALTGIEPDPRVVTLDQKQPENTMTLEKYLSNTVTKRRIEKGREMLDEYRDTLNKIRNDYGVQPKYIVALWAMESNFGEQQGSFSVIRSLATLAYEGRRAEFFSKELIAALRILEDEHMVASELTGSWAGAMGGCQFMPSTYINHAADGDGDGHRDIWNDPADVFASIASYLHSLGWNDGKEWGFAAHFPEGFSEQQADISKARSVKELRKLGIMSRNPSRLAHARGEYYAIYSRTPSDGAFLVTNNYKALLEWNRSRYFATAVGTLADAIGE